MALEIERKFKVLGDGWREGALGQLLKQGYLSTDPERTIRVRIEGTQAWMTIKGAVKGISRLEFEYPIPLLDGEEMLRALCQKGIIEKFRYRVAFRNHIFEVDEFLGDNLGLIIAEVELGDENENVELPPWIGEEVTGDRRFYNSYLSEHPYTVWTESKS